MGASFLNPMMTRASSHCAKVGFRSRSCGGAADYDQDCHNAPPNQYARNEVQRLMVPIATKVVSVMAFADIACPVP